MEAVRPLAVAQPGFDFPNFGTINGEDLYYFANSHWSDSVGQPKAVTVVRTPLDANQDLASPDMEDYLEQQRKKAATQPEKEDKEDKE